MLFRVHNMQASGFAVFDLRFDCRYVVHLQPVSRDGVAGHVTRLSLTLPRCQHVRVVGVVRPDCPDTGEHRNSFLLLPSIDDDGQTDR